MSKALEEKIKAIMEGKNPTTSEPKDDLDGVEKDGGPAAKDAKEVSAKNNKTATKGKPEDDESEDDSIVGKGKQDTAKVVEGNIPDKESDFSGVGKDTSAGEDNAKIQKGRSNKLDADGKTIKQDVKADKQDDNGDNAKIKKGESNKEKGGRLTQEDSMSALFDGEELSEDFKVKAETIFEAALAYAIEQKESELQEEIQSRLDEAVEEVKGELVEEIDGYLDEIVEQWLEDNAVALESGIKVELVGSFMEGMKNVFVEHYFDIPEEKVDIVESQAVELEALKEELETLKEENEKIVSEKVVLECEDVLSEQAKGLTAIEEEKFRSLAENIEFDTLDQFSEKVKTIRESYFKGDKSSQVVTKAITEDVQKSSTVNAVLDALQKGNLKFVNNRQ